MDFDFLYDVLLPAKNPVVPNSNVRPYLQKCALRCAMANTPIQDEWSNILYSILNTWHADVKMDMLAAVDYMMSACGYSSLGDDIAKLDKTDFWFLLSNQYENLDINVSKSKRLYYVTIAIFETINYWCWHDAPVQIIFDSKSLKETLRYGNIQIDWDSYKNFECGDSFLT